MARPDRMQQVFLYHLWACLPFAVVWMLWPQATSVVQDQVHVQALRVVTLVGIAYLAVRTLLTIRPPVRSPWSRLWPLADILLITAAIWLRPAPFESWLVLLYLFPIAEAALSLDLRWALVISGLAVTCYLAASGSSAITHLHYVNAGFRLFFLVLMASLLTALGREMANTRSQLAVANYRNRLSAEMHDGIQGYLVEIAARLELAHALAANDPQRAAQIATDQRHVLRQAADELRAMVRQLHAPALEHQELQEVLRQQLSLFGERHGVMTEFSADGDPWTLDRHTRHALLRTVQEGLTNIAKHAGAAKVEIRLIFEPVSVQCCVRDDGRGFDRTGMSSDPMANGGFGLASIECRAKAAGGRCVIQSSPGEGTALTVILPRPKSEGNR